MSIKFEIFAETPFDFHSQLKQLLRGDTNHHFLDAPRRAAVPIAAKKRGRPKKSESVQSSPAPSTEAAIPPVVAEVVTAPVSAQVETSAAAPEISYDTFREELQAVAAAIPNVLVEINKIVNAVGVAKIKEVKPEFYAKLIEQAKALVPAK